MKVYMFPGQGAQSRGMGATLFDEYPELTKKADEILGYSIKDLCLQDPDRKLNKTQYTQPSMYVVSALAYYKIAEREGKPDYAIGHSLGEFNALLAAGCFDFETGLRLVKKRGELMSTAPVGAMAAVMNSTKEDIEAKLSENNLNNIDLANYNTQTQIVISGLIDEIGHAEKLFQDGKILYYPLNTGGAFHSHFMKPAGEEFEKFLQNFRFSTPSIPVISNVIAREYKEDNIVKNLSSQIYSTVRWFESMEYLTSLHGISNVQFIEVGHGDVLTKMAEKIETEIRAQRTSGEKASIAGEKNINHDKDIVKTELNADQVVREWNTHYPVGTKVTSTLAGYGQLETRSEAVVLFGHRTAVYMDGYEGYFDLTELTVA